MHHHHFAFRSTCIALLCASFVFSLAKRAAADAQPYQARVIAAGAAVHSGPGENFYPTDTLKQGDVIEVYREKPGGWLAIRPPVNSFSWIAARDLIVKDGGLAEIAKVDVASRIGSRLNDRHNAAQVRLKKGEAVEVLGEESVNGEKWCKIAPPSGEFRWLQASLVEKLGAIPAPSAPAAPTAISPPAPSTADSGAPPLIPASKAPEATAPGAQSATPQAATSSSAVPLANQQPQVGSGTADLSHELAAIELRLSRMAAAPPNLWNTERLERDTSQLMARAQTQPDRDAVRITQDKINRFAEIVRRHNQSAGNVAQSGQLPITPLPNTVATTATGGPYDAVGILRPVVSRRPGAPQFALVDERGQVVTFLSSTPDLNLQPYLGHRIGVVGNRGFIPEFQRGTVTATRVTPLTERIVR
jgi:hypothetical protein